LAIVQAQSKAELAQARQLFTEYAEATQVDLCFQNFAQELNDLPGRYAPPEGRLFLALAGSEPVGCGALRKLDDGICEMKRLYVRPSFRRAGLGRQLACQILEAARAIGYRRMRLDTLGSMTEAIALYQSLGFRPIDPYYHNPSPCAVFMELALG
jgi:ribosomal protein S18 acetylase RimI-like enzyme